MKQTLIIQTNEGEDFLRGEHPDTRSNRQWIQFMNKKFPDLQWGMKQREKKLLKKKLSVKKKPVPKRKK